MQTVVLKLFAGQGTVTDGRTNGQSGDYMLTPLGSIIKLLTTRIIQRLIRCAYTKTCK